MKNLTVVKTNSKAFNNLIRPYIINAIDNSGYNKKVLKTNEEKLTFLAETFRSEYLYPENLKQYGNYQAVLKQWIMGLPSSFNIDYENYRIIEIAKEWGSLSVNATEKEEDRVIDNWFNLVAFKTIQLFRKYHIDYKTMPKQ